MKKLSQSKFILILVNLVCLIYFVNCLYCNYLFVEENKKLNLLMDEYIELKEQNNNYNILKNSYEKILEEENSLDCNNKRLEDKINVLNAEIASLVKQINDVNEKIKNLS